MAGFVDVLLRGWLLVAVSVATGGVAWLALVLRVEAHAKPDAAATASLRLVAVAAGVAAAVQASVAGLVVLNLSSTGVAVGAWLETPFAAVTAGRTLLAVALALLATRLATRPAGRPAWAALGVLAALLVTSSAALSHAAARVDGRLTVGLLDAVHQGAVAVWVGGLAHLTWLAVRRRHEPEPMDASIVRRFSTVALVAVLVLVVTGVALTARYVAEPAAMIGTAYGVMIGSKIVLLLAALGLGFANFRLVRRLTGSSGWLPLTRYAEVELGLAVTVLFAAASLTSLPPAVDVGPDRATAAEVTSRFAPTLPRLASPPIEDLLRTADPLMAPPGERQPVERAWSEYNHHWAGVFVLTMGVLALLERLGLRTARHWPLVLLGLAAFMFIRNDPRAWPLGPAGFWESMTLPDVLQHRAFVVIVIAFGVFEWMVRTGRLPSRPWAYVFPVVCAVGGGMLLTHSHAMFSLKEEFLTEVSHTPLGILGAFVGWSRWLELRLPQAGATPGWIWRGALAVIGIFLLLYRES
jgi:putative copper resistance protein D